MYSRCRRDAKSLTQITSEYAKHNVDSTAELYVNILADLWQSGSIFTKPTKFHFGNRKHFFGANIYLQFCWVPLWSSRTNLNRHKKLISSPQKDFLPSLKNYQTDFKFIESLECLLFRRKNFDSPKKHSLCWVLFKLFVQIYRSNPYIRSMFYWNYLKYMSRSAGHRSPRIKLIVSLLVCVIVVTTRK